MLDLRWYKIRQPQNMGYNFHYYLIAEWGALKNNSYAVRHPTKTMNITCIVGGRKIFHFPNSVLVPSTWNVSEILDKL